MRDAIVRARIEAELKQEAIAVLKANGLDLSDGIRLFLRQVVRSNGLPFSVNSGVQRVSARRLRQIKRREQKRDLEMVAAGKLSAESVLMIRPDQVRSAKIKWPSRSDV